MDNIFSNVVGNLANVTTAFIALIALVIAFLEYRKHKQQHQIEILSSLNARYANDENIRAVVISLMECLEDYNSSGYKFNKEKWKSAKDKDIEISTIYQRERFLRFFEELSSYIKSNSLDTKLIKKTFAYYSLMAASLEDDFVEDYNSECWVLFRNFVKIMKNTNNN